MLPGLDFDLAIGYILMVECNTAPANKEVPFGSVKRVSWWHAYLEQVEAEAPKPLGKWARYKKGNFVIQDSSHETGWQSATNLGTRSFLFRS